MPRSHTRPASANRQAVLPTPTRPARSLRWRLAAVGLSSLILVACGGGGGSTPVTPPPASANESAIATAHQGELLDYVRRTLEARGPSLSAYQAGYGEIFGLAEDAVTTSGTVVSTGTLVQEQGVDEDDLIKTDGSHIYTLQALPLDGKTDFARLNVYDRDALGQPVPAGDTVLSTVDDAWTATRGMLLAPAAHRLAVIGEGSAGFVGSECPIDAICIASLVPWVPSEPTVHVQVLDVSQPAQMPKPHRLEISGHLIGTRLIGNQLYVIAGHQPVLAFDALPATSTAAERKAELDRLSIAQVLPTIRTNGGKAQPLVAETDCWIQPANASTQIVLTSLTVIDLASPTYARTSRCFVGGSEAIYMSPSNVYLATTRYDIQTVGTRPSFAAGMLTDIHKFALGNAASAAVSYKGSGSVEGSLGWDRNKASYRMSEYNGDLRVLSFTGSVGWLAAADAATVAASPATLTILREQGSDASLRTVSKLPNAQRPAPLGKKGEQVYAVRFVGDRAYVVTFRQVDPLYVVDLSNPEDPRTVGELEVPGFSDWLYPVEGGLLFGVGKGASDTGTVEGVKVALFDVNDPAQPKVIDTQAFGSRWSSTALDWSSHGLSRLDGSSRTRFALQMQLLDARGQTASYSVQRFEVDHNVRSLAVKPAFELGTGWFDLGSSRTLLIDDNVYLLHNGKLQAWDW
jgi:hypothetical protein